MYVDADRLWRDLERNGAFGATVRDPPERWGRTVRCGSEANREAREYLVERLTDAGLDVRVDAVGNVAGRWTPPSADHDAAPVAAGSHLDSVPEGGIFDGPLGVYGALEAVRVMQDAGLEPDRSLEVVCFTEEEGGRFADGLLGSSVAAGKRSVEAASLLSDGDVTLGEALDDIGFRGDGRLDASEWDAWLELHVEQHTVLEAAGVPAGLVTDVTGITHCDVVVEGEADHAGTTPMDVRTDALAAASEFVLAVEAVASERAETEETAVGTVGHLDVSPDATNVVPGRVELGLDVRSVEADSIEHVVSRSREDLSQLSADRGVETALERVLYVDPTPMAERCLTALSDAAARSDRETVSLFSGAAHDSMHVASVTDAGMLFAPSRDGVSHNPREWTDPDDCADAAGVLAGALATLAGA